MNSIGRTSRFIPQCIRVANMSGELGSGAGKGGGGGGAIREAGGAFGKLEAAREEEYFYKKTRRQIEKLHRKIREREKKLARQQAIDEEKRKMKEQK